LVPSGGGSARRPFTQPDLMSPSPLLSLLRALTRSAAACTGPLFATIARPGLPGRAPPGSPARERDLQARARALPCARRSGRLLARAAARLTRSG